MEAQFLQSQSDRLSAIAEREQARRLEESVALAADAEASLEKRWSEFQRQIDVIEQLTEPPSLENERRDLRLSFNELQETLDTQRREVSLNDFLSDAILLRWHKILVAGQANIDKLQTKLLPKSKFIFRRYRQALANRQTNDDGVQDPKEKTDIAEASFSNATKSQVSVASDTLTNCLQDLESESIQISDEGIQSSKNSTLESGRQLDFDKGVVPLVWRRLKNCTVTWQPSTMANSPSSGGSVLHLVDLSDCQLEVNVALSSIHVSDCHNVSLRISRVQQVRLHTSRNLQVRGQITGGAILEGCQKIGVTTNCPNVQDFSWLRASRPSPNLERLPEKAAPEQPPKPSNAGARLDAKVAVESQKGTMMPANAHGSFADEDDDEL
eukprot:scaffold10016_cov170-Amphora_coffeaeformis.AAC.7